MILKQKVKPAIHSKRRVAQDSICFLQDNARPHTAALTMKTLRKLKWDVLPHPPYSLDLAPSDFHLFGPLKEFLGGKKFQSTDEVINVVQQWTNMQPKEFYYSGIMKLQDRWNKCIAVAGDYIEK